jgi:hypothetical protein
MPFQEIQVIPVTARNPFSNAAFWPSEPNNDGKSRGFLTRGSVIHKSLRVNELQQLKVEAAGIEPASDLPQRVAA